MSTGEEYHKGDRIIALCECHKGCEGVVLKPLHRRAWMKPDHPGLVSIQLDGYGPFALPPTDLCLLERGK
jgi:hypothetical protein